MDMRPTAVSRREALKRGVILLSGAVAVPNLAACGGADADAEPREATGEAAETTSTVSDPQRPVGVQLYTVRDRMEEDLVATLEQVAAIGYDELEFAGYFDRSPEEIRAILDRTGLSAPSVHVPIEVLREDHQSVLAAAETIGHQYVVVPYLAEDERTVEGYRQLAADLNRFGAAAQERGIRIGYHNHEFEFEPLDDGQTGYDILLAETDPSLVDMELDLFWTTQAGRDPLALFAEHPGRFPLWHVKDMVDLTGEKRMVSVGEGDIDFAAIFDQADQAGLRHFFVEHDNPDDSLASIRSSYEYLSNLLS